MHATAKMAKLAKNISPAAGDLNEMPKVAPWRLAILVILAKLAILAKIAMHAMAKMAKNHQPLAI